DKSRWPKWMRDAYTILDTCRVERGASEWEAVMSAWTQLEEAYAFESSAATIPATPGLRPSEVAQWIKHKRSVTREVKVESQDELVDKWWEWYNFLSPSWRKKDDRGRPMIVDGASGDWGSLVHPGANGILTVLLPLVWWRQGEEGLPSEDWLAAVRDVAWALKDL
ncbi:hypothetical protein C8R47DRAFT_919700, partial [Mycena vitilis]